MIEDDLEISRVLDVEAHVVTTWRQEDTIDCTMTSEGIGDGIGKVNVALRFIPRYRVAQAVIASPGWIAIKSQTITVPRNQSG